MESVNLKMNCCQWRHTKNGYVKIRRETFVLHDVKFAQTPSTPGGCYSLDSNVKSVMHKNNTETVWCQSSAYVDTLEWFLMKLPSRKAFSLKLVNQLEFMFTFTMSPENGKCKFKDELLTMAAYKEWECQDPKGDICSAWCQICTKSINIGNGGWYSLDCCAMHKNNTVTDWCHQRHRCQQVGVEWRLLQPGQSC